MELKAKFSLALAVALAFGCSLASAADPAPAKTLTPQQQRMVDCNKQAAPSAKQTQQEKMKSCSAEAKKENLAGDARKTFMSTCLKGDAAAAAH
jgi:hypothetical protein